MTATTPQRWSKALELFTRNLTQDGYAPSTIARVSKQVARFGRECGWAPWDVDAAVVNGWLDSLSCAPTRTYAYRTSLRTFYRWAFRTGRVQTDPTEETSKLASARTAPDRWHAAVSAFQRHLRASKLTEQTIALRTYQIVRVADELPVDGPWDVTTTDLVEWLAGHDWSRGSFFSYRCALRSFFGWAAAAGHISTDPALGIPKVRVATKCARPAPESAYQQALGSADDDERLMLRLAGELGLRRGEIAGLHTDDVQPNVGDTGWWLQVEGKGDRVRYLPLSEALARDLRRRGPGWVFPGGCDGHVAASTVTRKISRLLPDQWTAHTLRHRFATRAYGVDHDLFAVQQLLGHSRPETTRVYVATPASSLRRLVDAIG